MPLSWNEIEQRAVKFSNEWSNEERERAEKDTFWNEFFNVFGISRRRVATFEEPVKKLGDKRGFIDLFWRGTIIVEHKSKGKNLDKAYEQALDYFSGLKEYELPKYILVSDFERFRLYNLEEKTEYEFHLNDFHKNIKQFAFIAGYEQHKYQEEDPVNIRAAELMGQLHDQLKSYGYEGHSLEVYLVRLLFILFADDTGIFEKDIFKELLEIKTNEDGSNVGALMAQFFQVLNTPNERRMKNLDEHLAAFPYINGRLFDEQLPIAAFDSTMRNILLEASALDWGKISPAIFGSLFQSVMNPKQRRNLGAHYTSEKNILKLIKPLFLDELRSEFQRIRNNKSKLRDFHYKLSKLKFLDPACGSGNFLIITYRELRLLELDILRELHKNNQTVTDINNIIWINVDQFYGIEYDEFASRIAEVAMWLIDHQMNIKISEEFGQYFVRIPLVKSANIINGNALRIDWDALVAGDSIDIRAEQTNIIQVAEPIAHYNTINVYTKSVNLTKAIVPDPKDKWSGHSVGKVDYILGNPPFVGSKFLNPLQREEMAELFAEIKNGKILDYVSAWYLKAARYIRGTKIKCAFVSTNSITQGEQVSVLWNELLHRIKIKIHFAHRTFKWSNEAKGKAAVYVVIIGFANYDIPEKRLFLYSDIQGEPNEIKVPNINPYLANAKDILVTRRSKPLCDVPTIYKGNQPTEGGFLLLTEEEKLAFISKYPEIDKYIKPIISGKEYMHKIPRYCFWLINAKPEEFHNVPELLDRIDNVKKMRLNSTFKQTRELAKYPTLFRDKRNPKSFIVIPATTSEKRNYIPFGFFNEHYIPLNSVYIIPDAQLYHFGILMSAMHMAWVKYTCGRLKSDFRYSKDLVYNNYPWSKTLSEKNKQKVEEKSQVVLDVRAKYPDSSLADLYDPLTMPPELVKAHAELDKAVDLCYRSAPFADENERIEFLFNLYNEYAAPLLNDIAYKTGKRKRKK